MTGQQTTATAASRHDSMVAAYDAQQARLVPKDDAWAGLAQCFKLDPKRQFDPVLSRIASYIQPDDSILDVGGGAGRMSLPLASRSKDVVIVDPSPGMKEAFDGALGGSGITNARFVQQDWLEADGFSGDVALVTHVTYFVRPIAAFIQKLNSATRRRVIVGARSIPPPNYTAPIFRLLHNEEMAPVPGPQELLPVVEEMGIAAEVVDIGPASLPATFKVGQTRDEAVQFEVENAACGGRLRPGDESRLATLIREHFEDLFTKTDRGFMRTTMLDARDVLITWETG
jgi:hypothetical protein